MSYPVPFSFELYPARTEAGMDMVAETATALAAAGPEFVSVTYGAAGSSNDRSLGLLGHLHGAGARTVAHLTTVGQTRAQLVERAETFLAAGVRDFLALRGDLPASGDAGELDGPVPLTALLHEVAARLGVDISVGVAAYPQGHGRTGDIAGDIRALLAKQAAGASYAISQVVFEASAYGSFVAAARAAGVTIPIIPGLMPVSTSQKLERVAELTGVDAPISLVEALLAAGDTDREVVAIRSTARLAQELLAAGAPSIHLYAFNRHETVLAVLDELTSAALV
ncbi:methylenetetrahydrofolate reductase [Microbacterium stercoris]|uniref:Methylenetetrahydrofolate reductase n=1 Tax=Microbacterium stercoris TaxID=2820289 RepID=A0A939QFW3_9MICO|nr:methylenetetrahydrofolate reductase [Microbacterium stercoris]MBO3661899.1 methylenetetrahydrofolate reductase [Microbacterium stercoris]